MPGAPWKRKKREKPFTTSWVSQGSPEPHPARPHSRRGDAQQLPAPSPTLRCQHRHLRVGQQQKNGCDPGGRRAEVSGDTHAVTLGTGGTAGALGSGGPAGAGEAGSASDARSTLEEAEEEVRK